MEKVDNNDDDADDINFGNQNVMGDPDLVDSSSVDQVNTKDDSVGCFKNHAEVKVHSSALTSVSAHQDNNLLSEDCTSQLVSSQSKKVLCKFVLGPVGDKHTIETVGFCPSMLLAATGSLNGTQAVWDIPSQKLRHSCIHPDGVVKIHWCHSVSLLYTACLDGIVRLWDSRNGSSVHTWEGHTDHLLDLDVTRDDSTIVTACEDCTARIFSHH